MYSSHETPVEADRAAQTPPADGPFALVPAPLREALKRRGFAQLTAVQTAVLAADDGARDLQISSQTGSGKTVALGFVLSRLLLDGHKPGRGPCTLVITPTRELAMQVRDELSWLFADNPAVSLECVTGGTSVSQERTRLRRKPAVVVGTPGRLLDHINSKALDVTGVTQLVLDEADQMLDLGFRDELEAILQTMPDERRTHLVSATFPDEVRALTRRYQKNALHIEGTSLGEVHQDIEHVAHPIGLREHYAALVNLLLLAGDERTLVFVRTRADTAGLAEKLQADGFTALPISGDLAQAQRTRTLEAFKSGKVTALIATDVAARGLDIPSVTRVVHVDPPVDGATYTHRSGRTGRAGQKGQSVLLVPRPLQGRIRRILSEAGVDARWTAAPAAALVRARQQERAEASIRTALAAAQPSEQQRALAERLLEGKTPVEVVAGLVAMHSASTAAREPFTLEEGAQFSSARGHTRPMRREPGGARSGSFRRFRINWGIKQGAEPSRILAHVCRRGDIESRLVGSIQMDTFSSTFDIAAEVADAFAERVQVRDRRDPHLKIEPAGAGGSGGSYRPERSRPAAFAPRRQWQQFPEKSFAAKPRRTATAPGFRPRTERPERGDAGWFRSDVSAE